MSSAYYNKTEFADQQRGYAGVMARPEQRPNFGVRPGTWVTNQTGNIGYML
jgi:hypothetical protein